MLISLYFGSFNPLHKGHIGISQYLSNRPDVDCVRLVLSPKNPIKDQNILSDPQRRLDDLILTVTGLNDPKIEVSDIEFHLAPPLYTISTLRYFRDKEPNDNHVLVMGADNLFSIEKWYKWRELLVEFEVWVYPRKGYDIDQLIVKYCSLDSRILIKSLNAPLYDISSTEIRALNRED